MNTNVEDKYKYTVESDEFEFQAPSKKNYVFDGWYASSDFEGERISALKKGAHGNIDLYAKWTAEKFDIIYDLKGGVNDSNNPAFTSVESGEIVLLPATRDCYDFVCWKDKSNRVVEKIAASTACEVYLVAVWKAKEYTVEYELGGGIDAENKTSYTVEDGSFALNAPSRKGYTFDGWYSNEDFSGEKTESVNCSLATNLKFYAKWSIETYIIEYDLNGGDAVRNQTEYTVESEDISLHAPKREGYEFDGWYDKANNLVERIKKGSVGDIKLKAKWSALTYTVTFVSDCTISVAPIEYTIESDTIVIEYPKRNNYIFEGWFDAKGNKVDRIVGGTVGNFTLYAKWKAVEYTVTFESNGGDAVKSIIYTVETESFDLPVCNKSDYEFEGWFSGETKIERIEKGSCGNITLVAKWRAIGFKVSFETNGGSKVSDKTYNVEMTEFELPVPTREYYAFCGWFENSDLSGEAIENFATNKDVTLYAKWAPIGYTVTFESNGGESVKPCIYTVESQDFALQIPQKDFYLFEGWMDDAGNKVEKIDCSNPKDVSLTAQWSAIEYTITYVLNGGINGENPTIYTVESEDIVLVAPTKDGFVFDGWFLNDDKTERIAKGSHGNLTLVARWTEEVIVIPSDFTVENGIVTAYNGSATSITLHATENGEIVKSIANCAFDSVRTTVKEILIEEGIQSVEQGVFEGMSALQTLILPSTISVMHKSMLQDCASLVNLTLPFASFAVNSDEDVEATKYVSGSSSSVYNFGYIFGEANDSALYNNHAIYRNGSNAFKYADIPKSLKNITVLGGDICDRAFFELEIKTVVLKNVCSIGSLAFGKCLSLETLEVSETVSNFSSIMLSGSSVSTIYVASEEQKELFVKNNPDYADRVQIK